jgi:hypothetical protein
MSILSGTPVFHEPDCDEGPYEGILLEYCEGGSLFDYVRSTAYKGAAREERWRAAVVFGQGIAAGLEVRAMCEVMIMKSCVFMCCMAEAWAPLIPISHLAA